MTGHGDYDWFEEELDQNENRGKTKPLKDMDCQEFMDEIRGGEDRYTFNDDNNEHGESNP